MPGNFRDWADHPGAELLRSRGHNLHLSNYDTNRSVNVDRLRVTDYGYSHALYHFMSIARLENRNGGLDRVVLSGPPNGDDHFYVVDLSGNQWKTDGKYIDGRGVLGAVRDTYDAFDADLGVFSGTVAKVGEPIWWTGSFSGYLGTWDKNDPVKVASHADGVQTAMVNFAENLFGPGYELQRIYPAAMLSPAANGEAVEPASTNGLENFTAALAQRGAHFCLVIGKGDNIYIDPNHFADIFESSVVDGHCYLMARTKELSHTEYTDAYKPHLDAVMARAALLGVAPPKVMFCQKGAMWSVMEPAQYATYFPA
ncbi:MAG: hypothetical protein KAT00_07395, partial [Planctomycetes bacterium]|nr:hypothetical protein [Planctomycetota bacterium]